MTKKIDWFHNWFDSHHYLVLYSHRNEREAEVFCDLIEKFTRISESDEIVDFCCGAGRLAIELARRSYKVTGVDLSQNLIKQAKEKSKKENLEIEFINGDVRDLNFHGRFKLAVNFFTSFGYFDDDENNKVFENICKSVNDSGWVVIDYFNPLYVKSNLREEEIKSINGLKIIQKRSLINNRVVKEIEIISNGQNNKFYESVRLYEKDEFIKMFEQNNFKVEYLFGDYNGNELTNDSPRMIFFAKRIK